MKRPILVLVFLLALLGGALWWLANDQNEIRVEAKFDLVLSLISWGFHYPVETYLARVHEILRPGGHLIMDVRKKTDGMDQIRARFETVEVLVDSKKYERIRAVKSQA